MKIEDIDDVQSQYHALKKAVFHAAMTHVPEHPSKRYAALQEFYCEGDKVHVTINYSGSYSGTKQIELLPEEIAFCEPMVEIEEERDELADLVAELTSKKGGFLDRDLTIEETDRLFKLINAAPPEKAIAHTRTVMITHRLGVNQTSEHFHQFIDFYKTILTDR